MLRKSVFPLILLLCVGIIIPLQQAAAEERLYEIAFVKPIFTATAYQQNGFYKFFRNFVNVPATTFVTHDLHLLDTHLVDEWGWSSGFNHFIHSPKLKDWGIVLGSNAVIISDLDVHEGILFRSNGENRYEAVVVGFSEYVTAKQYSEYRSFVEKGGKLVLLDANFFLAEVAYNKETKMLKLVKGHGWSFDGKIAKRDEFRRWPKENAEWLGSNYFPLGRFEVKFKGAMADTKHPISVALRTKFGANVFKDYVRHEENGVLNPKAKIIAHWSADLQEGKIAAYELRHGKGIVFHTGIFGDNMIASDEPFQFLVLSMIRYEVPQKKLKISRVNLSNDCEFQNAFIELRNYADEQLDVSDWKIVAGERIFNRVLHGMIIPPKSSIFIEALDDSLSMTDLLILDEKGSIHHDPVLGTEELSADKEPMMFLPC